MIAAYRTLHSGATLISTQTFLFTEHYGEQMLAWIVKASASGYEWRGQV